jgi:hypothetical protein
MVKQAATEPLTQAAIRRHAQLLCAKQPGRMEDLLRDAGMSEAAIEAVMPLALANLALRIDGIEMLLRRWTARPQISPEEADSFFTVLDDAVADQTQAVVDDLLVERKRIEARVQEQLQVWQRKRDVTRPPSKLQTLLESGELPPDVPEGKEFIQTIDHGDGTITTLYAPKPNAEDEALYLRIRRERAAKQQRQKELGE